MFGSEAIPHLFERLFLISWENNRDCHITMPLSLKTMEVQIKGNGVNLTWLKEVSLSVCGPLSII